MTQIYNKDCASSLLTDYSQILYIIKGLLVLMQHYLKYNLCMILTIDHLLKNDYR